MKLSKRGSETTSRSASIRLLAFRVDNATDARSVSVSGPPSIMDGPAKKSEGGLLTFPLIAHSYFFLGLLEGIWSMGLFFAYLVQGGWQYGQDLTTSSALYREATGIALATILLMQIGNLIGRRYHRKSGLDLGIFKNKLLLSGIIIQIVFSYGVLYFPPLQKVLGTGNVPIQYYFLAWLGIPIIFFSDFIRKKLFEKFAKN